MRKLFTRFRVNRAGEPGAQFRGLSENRAGTEPGKITPREPEDLARETNRSGGGKLQLLAVLRAEVMPTKVSRAAGGSRTAEILLVRPSYF
jgi:hypothetical protein